MFKQIENVKTCNVNRVLLISSKIYIYNIYHLENVFHEQKTLQFM